MHLAIMDGLAHVLTKIQHISITTKQHTALVCIATCTYVRECRVYMHCKVPRLTTESCENKVLH